MAFDEAHARKESSPMPRQWHFPSTGFPKSFKTRMVVVGEKKVGTPQEAHCSTNGALDLVRNNKDPFYERELNDFRLLFELRAISVGAPMRFKGSQ